MLTSGAACTASTCSLLADFQPSKQQRSCLQQHVLVRTCNETHAAANVICTEVSNAACTHVSKSRSDLCAALQVFGKFAVVATATGCLYFMDVSKAASTAGLEAVGVLLLVLNLLYVVTTVLLVTKTGAKKARQMLHSVSSKAPAAAKRLLRPLSFGLQKLSSLPLVPAFLRRGTGTSADGDTMLPNSVVTDSAASSFNNGWLHRRTRPASAGRTSSSQLALLSFTDAVSSPEQSPEASQVSVLKALRHEQRL